MANMNGRPIGSWKGVEFSLPGYTPASIIISDLSNGGNVMTWGFMISPNGLTAQFVNDIQTNKTMAGYIITRNGPALGNLTLSGVFLDSLYVPERLRFMDFYEQYIESNQNNYMEFVSRYKQTITIEGYTYDGIIQNISISKNANQQFLYQYNISFVVYNKKKVYGTDNNFHISENDMKSDMGLTIGRSRGASQGKQEKSESVSKSIADILLSRN